MHPLIDLDVFFDIDGYVIFASHYELYQPMAVCCRAQLLMFSFHCVFTQLHRWIYLARLQVRRLLIGSALLCSIKHARRHTSACTRLTPDVENAKSSA